MQRQKLRDHLDELDAEFESDHDLGGEARQTLRELVDDIRAVLDRPQGKPGEQGESGEQQSLADRVTDTVQDFEASHPRLAARLGRVVDLLSAIGI